MELFVHRHGGDVELHKVDAQTTVADFVTQLEMPDSEAWLEDQEEPLAAQDTLTAAGVRERAILHVGKCKRVKVSVRFEAPIKDYDVHSSATLHRVYHLATSKQHGFDFSEHDKGEYTLQVRGTTEQPDLSRHVGVFADEGCQAAFDLVLQKRFQGS
jgi:hypothetical protein